MRIGKRWYSTAWLIPISIAGLIIGIAVCQQLRTYPTVQSWIASHPGTGDFQPPVTTGFPLWLRILHFLNLLFMLFIIRAGIQILADHPRLQTDAGSTPGRERLRLRGPVPPDRMAQDPPQRAWTAKDDAVTLPRWLGIPGIRHSIGLARWWHFSFDFLWVLTGVAFYVLLFTTGQWARLVPVNWSVIPNAISTAVQYGSLQFPANKGWTQYNGLQIIAYFVVVFIAAPLAFITGLLQAPAIAAKFGLGWGGINRQTARIVHFSFLVIFVGFIFIHTVMVWITGLLMNLNHITTGRNIASWTGWWLYVIWMAIVVAVWWAASPLTLRYPRVVQKTGKALIGWAKALLENTDPRATYPEKAISPFFWPNGTLPTSQEYANLRDDEFRDYTLRVGGLVDKPVTLSYEQLRAMPKQEQITQHYCIQGWSGVAKWGRTAMTAVLKEPVTRPELSPFPKIADYAFLSNCHTGALVAVDGTVDWLCVPRFDSPSIFGSLLDREAGRFRFGPYGIEHPTTRVYVPGTNVVETTWKTATGWIVVRDALTMGPHDTDDCVTPHTRPPTDADASHMLVRTATCIEGRVEVEAVCEPAFDYGHRPASWQLESDRHRAAGTAAGISIRLQSDIKLGVEGNRIRGRHTLNQRDIVYCVLS